MKPKKTLTLRQIRVYELSVLSDKEISSELGLSVPAVRKCIRALQDKLGVDRRRALPVLLVVSRWKSEGEIAAMEFVKRGLTSTPYRKTPSVAK